MAADDPLSPAEFAYIYAKVPRLTVELLLTNQKGVFLTQRSIAPCQGQWHLPGGTVRFGESVLAAVNRVAKRELGIGVISTTLAGYIEYPSHYNNGLDSPVGLVFHLDDYRGDLRPNHEALAADWFTRLPDNTHADLESFLLDRSWIKPALTP